MSKPQAQLNSDYPEARRWLAQAHEDLITAEANLREERFYVVALFAHQAAEKALKAIVMVRSQALAPKIHDLRELGVLAKAPESLTEALRELTPVYMTSRYPDALEGAIPAEAFTAADAQSLLAAAKGILSWATDQI